jgi:hypothetical protein
MLSRGYSKHKKNSSVRGVLEKQAPQQRDHIRHECSFLLPSGVGHQELYRCKSCDLRYKPGLTAFHEPVICAHCIHTCHKGHIIECLPEERGVWCEVRTTWWLCGTKLRSVCRSFQGWSFCTKLFVVWRVWLCL